MRLVDVDKLERNEIDNYGWKEDIVYAEPVARCKDCFQSVVIGEVLHCTYWNKDTDENGYCHEGG